MKTRCALLFSVLALVASPQVTAALQRLEVKALAIDGLLVATISNRSNSEATVSNGYLISGRGGGNVVPILVSSLGQLIPPCSTTTPAQDFFGTQPIKSGATVEIARIGLDSLSRLHCLDEGVYTLAVAYRGPSGDLFFSNQVTVVVKPDGSASERDSD